MDDNRQVPALLVMVVLVALNLRPFLTATGPLADEIGAAGGLGLQGLALLTLIPILLMGALAFAGPRLEARFGARRIVIGALALVAAGSLARLRGQSGGVMLATAAVLGVGVALVQAVFPGVIKRLFPDNVGVVTGLYSAILVGGGALGAQAAPLVATLTGTWQWSLGWLAAPALLAMLAAALVLPRTDSGIARRTAPKGLLAWPRTWLLIACFGLVNGGYSSAVAWLASSFQAAGIEHHASGSLLAAMALAQATAALVLPACAGRGGDRRPWLGLTLVLQAIGYIGLITWPAAAPLALTVVLGAGLGGSFALTLVVALDQFDDPAAAGALAALMQGGGFILAALPPYAVAVLHDLTGSYAAGWMLHLLAITIVAVLTLRLSPRARPTR